jgi:hypothetical protein
MTKRRIKKACVKLFNKQRMTGKEYYAVIDYFVDRYGSLSAPMVAIEIKRTKAMREKYTENFVNAVYQKWLEQATV